MTNQTTVRQQDKTSAKYIAQYAEPEVQSLVSFPAEFTYQHVLVIPAFMESAQFIERFVKSKLAEQKCLLIVVVNQPDNDFGQRHQQAQIDLVQGITAQGEKLWQQDNLQLVDLRYSASNTSKKSVNSAILIVDRYHQPIPAEQGVGLARKIGADLAVALYLAGKISSPWIHSSDADAYLPDNYLIAHTDSDVQGDDKFKSAVASCCNFYHYSENQAIHQANWLYERALRYYVAGLHFAKSPYAYFTIGSTLSFNMLA